MGAEHWISLGERSGKGGGHSSENHRFGASLMGKCKLLWRLSPAKCQFLLTPTCACSLACDQVQQILNANRHHWTNTFPSTGITCSTLTACPMLSNKASHKLECSGRFSSPFYPIGRQCDFQSKGFIFAAQAAGLPQKHSPVYDIRRMQKQNGSPHRTWSCCTCCSSQHWSACSAYVAHASSHQACRGRRLRETDPPERLGFGLKKQREAQWSGDKAQRAMAL